MDSSSDSWIFPAGTLKKSARPLSLLTDGLHSHTLLCPDEDAFRRVKERLRTMGILSS